MADRIGQQLGNYRILRELGRGGFAHVYLGEHIYLKSHAALKILQTSLAEKDVARFLSEAQTLVRLRHPSIVRVLEFAIEQDAPVLMMDYAPGGTLRQLHSRGTRLPLATVITYIKQAAAALHYAHSRNIIHRDVKPENLLLGEQQELLLSDFGLALLAPSPDELSTQEMAGTVPYMAPEQIRGKPGFASDQYALGIVAYEWLCGARPFEGTTWQILHQHLEALPPPLREKNADIPEAVEEVVLRALAKDPRQRFVSVQAFSHALERVSRTSSVESGSEITAKLKRVSAPSSALPPDRSQPDSYLPYGVFLAAASADEAFAAHLKADLEARGRGVFVWNGRLTGTKYAADQEEALRQEIRAAQIVVVVLSPRTRSSRTIKRQLQIADMYGRQLLLVWKTGDEWAELLPDDWESRNVLDLIDARGVQYEPALDEIVSYLNAETEATAPLEVMRAKPREELPEPRNPYKGLRAFTQRDAGDFFGRNRLIENLIENVAVIHAEEQATSRSGRLLTVIGPSGSGKSSVVMAGLLPWVRQGALPGSEAWIYLEPMVPGTHPIEALGLLLAPHFPQRSFASIREDLEEDSGRGLHLLASQLVREQPGARVVLLVDQFEELFTQTEAEAERQHFIDLVLAAASETGGPLVAVLTLRADFYDRPMRYAGLHRLMQRHLVQVLPMELEELRATIEYPAALPDVQLSFEGNLVGDLLFEMQGQHGALPLLQFTLEHLFERRIDHRMTLEAYREIGGVKGALARHAERTYTALPSEEHRELARVLFLRLIDPGATEQDTTRRRAPLSEFILPDSARTQLLQETIDAFVTARLLIANQVGDATTIEVSHEAIIREWPRLWGWLRVARDDILLQQAISADAAEWRRRERPVDRLYRETELTEAQAWMERSAASSDEVEFLQSSQKEQERQRAAEESRHVRELSLQRRVVTRQRLLIAVLSLFTVVVIILATVAEVSRQQADAQRQLAQIQTLIAKSHALAAQVNLALLDGKTDQALLLGTLANQTYSTYDGRNSLFTALTHSPHIIKILHPSFPVRNAQVAGAPMGLAFSNKGQNLVTLIPEAGGFLWSTNTGKARTLHVPCPQVYAGPPIRCPFGEYPVLPALGGGIAISQDGRLSASISTLGSWVWDTQTGGNITRLENFSYCSTPGPGTQPPRPECGENYTAIAFSHTGNIIATSRCIQYSNSGCSQATIRLWSKISTKFVDQVVLNQANLPANLVFSSDDKLLASSNIDGTIDLWGVTSGAIVGQFKTGDMKPPADSGGAEGGPVSGRQEEDMAFSPDGKMLASINGDGAIGLWDVATQKLIKTLIASNTGAALQLAFSPDGKMLVSSSKNNTVSLWDVAAASSIGQPLIGHSTSIAHIAFSPDGKMVASIDVGGTIILWNTGSDNSIYQQLDYSDVNLSNGDHLVDSAVFSPDGKVIVAGNTSGKIIFRDGATKKILDTLDASSEPFPVPGAPNNGESALAIESLSFSPDGQVLAAGRFDGAIMFWNALTKKPLMRFRFEPGLRTIVYSPSGHVLASTYDTGDILLINVATGKLVYRLTHHTADPSIQQVSTVAFSQDGQLLAAGSDNNVILWNIATGKPFSKPLKGHSAEVESVAFSPKKRILASFDTAGTVIVWNLTTDQPVATALSSLDDQDQGLGLKSTGLAFSPNGAMLAAGSTTFDPPLTGSTLNNVSVTVWNLTEQAPLVHPLLEQQDLVSNNYATNGVAFSPDGQRLLSVVTSDPFVSHITLWSLNVTSWQTLACGIANRNFTIAEWKQFTPGEPYRKVCANLPADVSVVDDYLYQAHSAALIGNSQGALSNYALATHWAIDSGDADSSNSICWEGSLDQFAKSVLPACDNAVNLDPNNVDYRDSRGVARALAGDTRGAIADFTFVVQPSNGYGDLNPKQIQERRQWLQELEQGRNPFDSKTLAALQHE